MRNLTISGFPKLLHESLQRKDSKFPAVKVARSRHVYVGTDPAQSVFFLEFGQIKLSTVTPEGKESLLALHTAGDTFGESCLTSSGFRHETATAMEDTILRRIRPADFFAHLRSHSLVEGFAQYLASRVAEQQRIIASLIAVDSEHRLGETLLLLARKLGKPDPRSTLIEQKITHEELSAMVGTTRPRITTFMLRFRSLGLIEISPEHFLIVKEKKLSEYLTQVA